MKKSTLLHLRIPFSIFLMPVYLFATSTAAQINILSALLAFVALHFFLYPASNGYNSYFDKDEGSIGGLEKPPPVDRELYLASLWFDLIALLIALLVDWRFSLLLLVYGLVSKAYSWDKIRLKKYPIAGWLTVGIFQGAFTFLAVRLAVEGDKAFDPLAEETWLPALLSSAMLLGSYPMTQIYQHEEDGKRGDQTLSRLLGIRGTFLFTGGCFAFATLGFLYYFDCFWNTTIALLFPTFLLPVLLYFGSWMLRTWKDEKNADFKSTMRLNLISSICLSLFFGVLFLFRGG